MSTARGPDTEAMPSDSEWSRESRLVAGARPQEAGQPLNTPIVPASNFLAGGEFGYARDHGTPSWVALERLMADLEGGHALSFGSGMAAVAAVFDQLSVGAHIVWPEDCYQGVAGIIAAGETNGRWTSHRVATADTEAWIHAAGTADLIWLESPSNPLLRIADLEAIGDADRSADSIMAVDNTLATPLNQRPLELGADISVTSATKYIGGHSDLLCGVTVTADRALHERISRSRLLNGATPGNLEAFLACRGARTLALRLGAGQHNAGVLAERLHTHGSVELVRYPGLVSHPQHELARRQLQGMGTIISFDVVGGAAAAERLLGHLRLIAHATSFGAVESTIERRASIPGQEHLPEGLLRLSVGIEKVDDLWGDLDAALSSI